MKRIKRVVDTGFWSDDKVMEFSPEDKYFMLFLLTNEYTTQLGIYYLPIKKAAFDLGYTQDSVRVLIDRFENKYSILRYSEKTSEIAIKNYLLYSVVSGGKPVLDSLLSDMESVKDKDLLCYVYKGLVYRDITNDTVKRFITVLKDNINDNDNDNDIIVDKSPTNRTANRKNAFKPPSLEEVEAYCKERGNKVDAKQFFDYYNAGHWHDRNGAPVKNWKQKMISTWEKHADQPSAKPTGNKFTRMERSETYGDLTDLEAQLLARPI